MYSVLRKSKMTNARACDGCYRRKVKCSGEINCIQCVTAKLSCTFQREVGRRGPKVKTFTKHSRKCFVFIKDGALPTDLSAFEEVAGALAGIRRALEQGWRESSYLKLVMDFRTIEFVAMHCTHDKVSQCLIVAITLFLLAHDITKPTIPMVRCSRGCDHQWKTHLRKSAQNLRDHGVGLTSMLERDKEWISILSLMSRVYDLLELPKISWYYLQEAITISQIGFQAVGMNQVVSGLALHTAVMERCRAINEHKSVCIDGQKLARDGPLDMMVLYELLKPFNNTFLTIWNNPSITPSFGYLLRLRQHVLNEPNYAQLAQPMRYCYVVAQHWLLSVIWQLAMRNQTAGTDPVTLSQLFSDPVATVTALLREIESFLPNDTVQHVEFTVGSNDDSVEMRHTYNFIESHALRYRMSLPTLGRFSWSVGGAATRLEYIEWYGCCDESLIDGDPVAVYRLDATASNPSK